jgi:poly(A) RNA polymerase GLD2
MAGNKLFDMNFDIRLLTEMPDIDHLRTVWQSNNYQLNYQSIGQLFIGFLEYYSHSFDFYGSVISIRSAKLIDRNEISLRNDFPKEWKYICIEEPFDGSNTAHTCTKYSAFNRILVAFQKSYHLIQQKQTLSSVLNKFLKF